VYLHAYMPKLQTSGGLCYFLHDHLGHPVPWPALFKPRTDRFIAAIQTFASDRHVPLMSFEHVDSKDAFVAPYRARFTGREGVVVIGVAQEKMRSFRAHKRPGRGHTPVFDFARQSVAVNHYSFCVHDRECGPAFLKIDTYLPYPVKLCLNGHEWVKQHLRRDRSASKASTTASSGVPIRPHSKGRAMRLRWPISTRSSIAGRSACHGP
jgi:hypothetical protein